MSSGAGVAKSQLDQQNKLQTDSYNSEMGTLNSLKSSLSGYLSGTKGYSDSQMSNLTSSALNQNNSKYNQAGTAVRSALMSRGMGGGATPTGGSYVSGIAGLEGSKASDAASSLNTINLNNAQQALTNQFNAASVLSGNAQTMAQNTSTFGQGASSADSTYANAQQHGILNTLAGSAASAVGSGLGTALTGGLGSAASTLGSGNYGW